MDRVSCTHFHSTLRNYSSHQARKFARLNHKNYPKLEPKKVVINLSSKPLSAAAESVLTKGHDFAVTPKRIPVEDIITSVETAVRRLQPLDAEEIRLEVATLLKRAKPPPMNISKDEAVALKELKSDKDILVLRADKGNSTVILNTSDYKDRIGNILSSGEFKKIKSDPTKRIERKTAKLLKSSSLDKTLIQKLTPKESVAPRLYGMPKIHKTGYPLRPIVSSIRCPTYELSSYLSKILQPHIGQTSSFVRDSTHFVNIIKELRLQPTDLLVSFDVVSLFTKVPVQDVVKLISERFPQDITNLYRHCLTSCYFTFDNQFYEQVDGVAMGSALSPAVANLFMEHFEKNALDSSRKQPKCWLRYVDDTFVIWPHGKDELQHFLEHLNGQHPQINFTMEVEDNGRLPFLDVLVTRNSDGSLSRSVYRKSTHTNRYIHASSHHHPAQKCAVISTLFHRAKRICDNSSFPSERQFLSTCLSANGYSRNTINRISNQLPKKKQAGKEYQGIVYLPYIKNTTDRIGRIFRKFGIKTVYSSKLRISNFLQSPKDPQDQLMNPGVYNIKCDCGLQYIGETGRSIHSRISEHERAIRLQQPARSALALHCLEEEHRARLAEAKLISVSPFYYQRIIREAIEISKCKNSINLDKGNFSLPRCWSIFFR